MINVTTNWGWAIAIAAIGGMLGGFVYDLVLDRHGDSGLVERFGKFEGAGRKYFDIGTWASVFIGGVAAMAFLYFLGPEVRTVVVAAVDPKPASTRTVRGYSPFKLIPASLIVGSGGVSFVKAMRERLLKLIAETNLTALASAVREQGAKVQAEIEASKAAGVAAPGIDPASSAAGRAGALVDLANQLKP